MTECSVAMPSYTYAMKAEKLLKAAGISCSVRRRDNASAAGCGYSLIISGECSQAVAVLRKYSIPFTGVSDGGE